MERKRNEHMMQIRIQHSDPKELLEELEKANDDPYDYINGSYDRDGLKSLHSQLGG